ncbi:MAG: hypothetical protein E6J43_04370, partial [Chloroflexi bacterium]
MHRLAALRRLSSHATNRVKFGDRKPAVLLLGVLAVYLLFAARQWPPTNQRASADVAEPVAIALQPAGFGNVVGLSSGGNFVRDLSPTPSEYGPPQWSPNGNFLAFIDANGGSPLLRVVTVDGEPIAAVPAAGGDEQFSWSPDSTAIV